MIPRLPIQVCDNRKKMELVRDFVQWWDLLLAMLNLPFYLK
jgi:hypothetical protein